MSLAHMDTHFSINKVLPLTWLTSFSSALRPAIEISTLWEIIVGVSSACDLPRPWQVLRGLSGIHLFSLSAAFGLPSGGLWIASWFRSV